MLDFIDMKSMHHRDELYKLMKKLTKNDRAKTRVLPVSKLGLMEMTRQREHESIQDAVYVPCPYCRGSGLVKSAESMSVEIQRRLRGILRNKFYKKIPIRITMHPEVLQRLKNEDAMLLEALETAPECRRMGYGTWLIQAALQSAGDTKVYSHVSKWNTASLRTHEKCGFVKEKDYAVYTDGSVNDRCVTLCYQHKME